MDEGVKLIVLPIASAPVSGNNAPMTAAVIAASPPVDSVSPDDAVTCDTTGYFSVM
jgi:hypothetical protein